MRILLASLVLSLTLLPLSLRVVAQSAAATAYQPTFTSCPPGTALVRQVGSNPQRQSLSAGEAEYVFRREQVTRGTWPEYLTNVQSFLETSQTNISLPEYVSELLTGEFGATRLPRLGIATSGGGYRAAIFGAGILNALDGRNQTSVKAGTGGLLQAATYLSGLSGGSWLVLSLTQAGFPMLPELIFGPSPAPTDDSNAFGGWLTDIDLVTPGSDIIEDLEFASDLLVEISLKLSSGFPVTVTDVWARALSRHFANGTTSANFFNDSLTHGAGITFSSITAMLVVAFVVHPRSYPSRSIG